MLKIANNINGNNIYITTENDFNSVNTIINNNIIDSKETIDNLNNVNFNIGNNINISQVEEQHIHDETHDTWGGDIGRALAGGAITGAMTIAGVKGGEYIGNIAGNTLNTALGGTSAISPTGNIIFSNTFASSIQTGLSAATTSYTSTIGNAMSNTVINGGNLGDVLKSGRDTATDTDILKNTLTSGLSAGITAGITEYLDKTNSLTKGIISNGNLDINPEASLKQQFTSKLVDSATSNITSTAIQSTINGDSFTEALKHQAINTIVMAGADYAANQIGQQYHTGQINKTEQLLFHAALGSVANGLTGNDILSGAIAGVSAEIFGQYLVDHTKLNDNSVKEYSGLFAGITSLIVGKTTNLDSSDIRNNVFSGYRVGKNAVENNLLYNQLLGDSKTTSEYNEKGRKHPTQGMIRPHKGVDTIPDDSNNNIEVHAAADGTVIYTDPQIDKNTGKMIGWGNQVVIEHTDENGNKYITRYAHLKEKSDVPVGTKVEEGQPIGIMGNTGGSAGAHLHYELEKYEPDNPKANSFGYIYLNPQLPENNIGNYDYLWQTPYQENKREFEYIMEQFNSPRITLPVIINH